MFSLLGTEGLANFFLTRVWTTWARACFIRPERRCENGNYRSAWWSIPVFQRPICLHLLCIINYH